MRMNKHFVNLLLIGAFGFLVMLPFGLTNVRVDSLVLGEYMERDYYKRVVGASEEVMIRNVAKEEGKEQDFITVLLTKERGVSFFPLYEISNLNSTTQNFVLYPGNQIVGEMENKRVSLRVNGETDVIFYYDANWGDNKPEVLLTLKAGEAANVGLWIESTGGEAFTPLSFDLYLEKR